ncbi:MAG: hypothetical protein NZU63_07385 [Gemmataceae bacterium]|nr:hypothetical protein [Gemmataceae bacterium]MDW8242787.1 DUF6655 family protein [Thermogemmata sp.]
MSTWHHEAWLVEMVLLLACCGCGTTRMTDTPRTATEMLLLSHAVDSAVGQIDFSPLAGRHVYVDAAGLDKDVVDKAYLISLVRQQAAAAGAILHDDRNKADYIVEVRSGGIGTDRHSVLVGTPALQLPSVVPGMPTNIPEIALVKKNDQRGVAKIALFAYNRHTGRAVWQSGNVESVSRLKDLWVLGAGPFSKGSIRKRPELAGEPLPTITDLLHQQTQQPDVTAQLGPRYYADADTPVPSPYAGFFETLGYRLWTGTWPPQTTASSGTSGPAPNVPAAGPPSRTLPNQTSPAVPLPSLQPSQPERAEGQR